MSKNKVKLQIKDLKGSRLRCLILTSSSRKQVAASLTELIEPFGIVDSEKDNWMPQGFLKPIEAKLSNTELFLNRQNREQLSSWWLSDNRRANSPNWDIAATCNIEGKSGLLLIEAKAHQNELAKAGKTKPSSKNGWKNHEHIGVAIKEANNGLSVNGVNWALSHEAHYQLCNRFAWSWKLASMGMPIILVYLGFLNADEMPTPFPTSAIWRDSVLEYSKSIVPDGVWENKIMVGDTPIIPIIRSLDMNIILRE